MSDSQHQSRPSGTPEPDTPSGGSGGRIEQVAFYFFMAVIAVGLLAVLGYVFTL